ncbi:TMV resistance protein N [Spatholobus suberectus]|nr:TMV resistance protein N [Spatholobus suberectus]
MEQRAEVDDKRQQENRTENRSLEITEPATHEQEMRKTEKDAKRKQELGGPEILEKEASQEVKTQQKQEVEEQDLEERKKHEEGESKGGKARKQQTLNILDQEPENRSKDENWMAENKNHCGEEATFSKPEPNSVDPPPSMETPRIQMPGQVAAAPPLLSCITCGKEQNVGLGTMFQGQFGAVLNSSVQLFKSSTIILALFLFDVGFVQLFKMMAAKATAIVQGTYPTLQIWLGLYRSHCGTQGFVYLTVLDFGYCEWITCLPDVSGLPNLEKLSFKHSENLIQIHESVGFLDKLRILDAVCCKKLRTFPPIRLTSLEQFNLSHCSNLEVFPEILGKMENITELHITGSPIKELPFSIQNLTQLHKLGLQHCGMVQIPGSIVMLAELGSMFVSQCEGLQLSKLDKGEKMVSKSSNMEYLILSYCNISDDFLPIGLTLFANVKDLNLSGNNFTFLHACIKECQLLRNLKLDDCRSLTKVRGIPVKLETLSMKGCRALESLDLTVLPECTEGCHFLKELVLDDCVLLQDIRGILSNLDHFSAKNCISLTSSCTSMLLNQKSIEAGNKMFSLPGKMIPKWFAHYRTGESISFCFRNKFPAISICLVIGPVDEQPITVKFSPRVFINSNKQSLGNQKAYEFRIATDHIFLFDIQLLKFEDNADVVLSDDEWNRVVVSYADHITNHEVPIRMAAKYSGIHTTEMEDVKFTNPPEEMIKVNLEPNSLEGHQRVKITTNRPQKHLTVFLSSPILASDLDSRPTPSVEGPWEDVQGVTSECHPVYEVHPTTVQNEPPIIERCEGDDIYLEAVSTRELESEDSSSNITGSDSEDPFDQIDKTFCVSGEETRSFGACSGDASLTSIRDTIGALELLMIKDLSEVSSDPATQSQLNHLMDLLTRSSHRKVTVELKEALVKFKGKALLPSKTSKLLLNL